LLRQGWAERLGFAVLLASATTSRFQVASQIGQMLRPW
jgi:hypothetical protein